MTALLLTLAVFAAWWIVGLALLAALRVDTSSLRVALTAPVVGSCVLLVALFVFSAAGMAIDDCAIPIVCVVMLAALAVLAVRRPIVPRQVLAVIVVCIGGLLLTASPMLTFGFGWIGNGNNDFANYSLSAWDLMHHGLLSHFDLVGLAHDRDFSTVLGALHQAGSRPGADITLAGLADVTGLLPYEAFMPFIFAAALSGACAAGALAMQAARRWWAAPLAAALLLLSPEATFGTLQQLLPQVWGLGLACALFAFLMRKELHQKPGPEVNDLIVIGLLTTGIVVVYVELASTLFFAYALYVVVLTLRRELSLSVAVRLWLPVIVIVVVILNSYLPREVVYVFEQARVRVGGGGEIPTFGYSEIPIALAGIIGIATMPASLLTVFSPDVSIVLGILAVAAILVGALLSMWRGMAAAVVLVAYALLAILLVANASDFGLFKLYMYLQPFLAACIAIWVSRIEPRWALSVAAVALVALMAIQLQPERKYVQDSTDPVELVHASSPGLLPAFRRDLAASPEPVISVTENPTLGKLEDIVAGERPIFDISAQLFERFVSHKSPAVPGPVYEEERKALALTTFRPRHFNLLAGDGEVDRFGENELASQLLASGHCQVIFPSGSEVALNRWAFPEGSPDLEDEQCRHVHSLLVFTASSLGEGYYEAGPYRDKSLYQLEPDPIFPGQTMSGIGRYILLHVLGATPGERLELNFTLSYNPTSELLPPASVVGQRRYELPVTGQGSARVLSASLEPQQIAGQQYLLLDLGRNGQLYPHERSGLEGLFGADVVLDPRFLTAYLRDVSLISPREYSEIKAPTVVRGFPRCLTNKDLEYSGIYEDGWVGKSSYLVMASGPGADLQIDGAVPQYDGGHMTIFVNGHTVLSRTDSPGPLHLSIPVRASSSNRHVELRFSASTKLPAPDLRRVSALLKRVAIAPASS